MGGALAPEAAALALGIGADEARLLEDQPLEEAREEIAAAGAAEGGKALPLDRKPLRDRCHEAVDGRALLRRADEIDAAQQGALLEPARREDRVQELAERTLERRQLLREAEDERAALDVAILAHAREQARVEPSDQAIELRVEFRDRAELGAIRFQGEGHAPDLLPRLAVE